MALELFSSSRVLDTDCRPREARITWARCVPVKGIL